MRRVILAEKVLSIGLAGLVILCLPGLVALKFAFVLGHAHILAAWLYTYLAGKMTPAFFRRFFLLNLLLFGSYWLWPWPWLLTLVTPLFFLLHFLIDEVHLLRMPINLRRSPMHLGRSLEIGLFFVLYAGQVLDASSARLFWMKARCGDSSLWLAAGVAAFYAVLWLNRRLRPDWGSAYFGLGSLLFLCLLPMRQRFHYGGLLAFLILVHVLDWYLHFYLQLPTASPARGLYLKRISVFIGFSALVWWVGARGLWLPARQAYEETFYNLWSLVHLTFSLRLADFQAGWKLPKLD
jgi:hypothetical protein